MTTTRWLVVAAVVGPIVWFFAPAMWSGRSFCYRDGAHYYRPLYEWASKAWRGEDGGGPPLWNRYENCGAPALADATVATFYPMKLVFALPLTTGRAYTLYLALHLGLAGLGAYLCARRWRASVFGAAAAAAAYAFGGQVLFQYCNVVYLVGAAWLPFAFLCAERMIARRDARWAVALGAVLAMMTLGGDPQSAYHGGLIAAGYAFFDWLGGGRKARTNAGDGLAIVQRCLQSRTFALAAAAGSCLLLCAVQLLPGLGLGARSRRAVFDRPRNVYEAGETLLAHDSAPSEVAVGLFGEPARGTHHNHIYQFSLSPWRTVELAAPNLSGRPFPIHRRWIKAIAGEGRAWSPSIYLGLLPLIAALAGMRFFGGSVRSRWLTWTVVWFLLGSFGWYGVGWVIHEAHCGFFGGDPAAPLVGQPVGGPYWLMSTLLPGYVYFRYPAKLFTVAALALSLLAARGWDGVFAGRSGVFRWLLVGAAVVLGAGFATLLALSADVFPPLPASALFGPFDAEGALADLRISLLHAAIVAALGAALTFAAGWKTGPRWTAGAAMLLTAVELTFAHAWMLPTAPDELWTKTPSAAEAVATGADSAATPRVFRAHPWLPARFGRSASADRLAETVAWDRDTLYPKYNLLSRTPVVEAHGAVMSADHWAVLQTARIYGVRRPGNGPEPHASVLQAMAVTHVVAPTAIEEYGMRQPQQLDAAVVAPLTGAYPRVRLVRRAARLDPLVQPTRAELLSRTKRVFFPHGEAADLSQMAFVEAAQFDVERLLQAPPRIEAGETRRIVRDEGSEVEVAVSLKHDALLVLADSYDSDWTAELVSQQGRAATPLEVYRVNRIQRGVLAPAGEHRIRFVYRPTAVYWGAAVSGAAWLALAVGGCVVWVLRQGRRRIV